MASNLLAAILAQVVYFMTECLHFQLFEIIQIWSEPFDGVISRQREWRNAVGLRRGLIGSLVDDLRAADLSAQWWSPKQANSWWWLLRVGWAWRHSHLGLPLLLLQRLFVLLDRYWHVNRLNLCCYCFSLLTCFIQKGAGLGLMGWCRPFLYSCWLLLLKLVLQWSICSSQWLWLLNYNIRCLLKLQFHLLDSFLVQSLTIWKFPGILSRIHRYRLFLGLSNAFFWRWAGYVVMAIVVDVLEIKYLLRCRLLKLQL